MKGFIAVCLVICVALVGMLVAATTYPDVYYEDVVSGEYVDEYVCVKARRDMTARNLWEIEIENKAGEFVAVDGDDDWSIRYTLFDECGEELEKAYKNGEPVKVKLTIYKDGDARILDVYPYEHTTGGAALEGLTASMPILLVGGIVVVVVFAVLAMSGPTRTYRQEPPRENRHERTIVSVRIMDSTGPAYGSRTSTASAVGRAVVGDMLAGPTGAFIGAATAKQKPVKVNDGTMTFRITWSDGSQTTETVTKGSYMYRKLIDMVP